MSETGQPPGETTPETPPDDYKCEHCPYKSTTMKGLRTHITKRHSAYGKWNYRRETTFKCLHCQFTTENKPDLDKHVFTNHNNEAESIQWFGCAHCPYTTVKKSTLTEHTEIKHETKTIKWFECGRSLYKIDDNSKKRYKCGECIKDANKKHTLSGHVIAAHSGWEATRWLLCPTCDFEAPIPSAMIQHLTEKHNIEIEAEPEAATEEIKKPVLVKSYKLKDAENMFLCISCSYKTQRRYDLDNHVFNEHKTALESIPWFGCRMCQHKTLNKNDLAIHITNMHGPLDPVNWYYCARCPYKIIATEGRTVYKCGKCKYKTKVRHYLDSHVIAKHCKSSAKKCYVCKSCPFEAQFKHSMRQHLSAEHGYNRWQFEEMAAPPPSSTATNQSHNNVRMEISQVFLNEAAMIKREPIYEEFSYDGRPYAHHQTACNMMSFNVKPEPEEYEPINYSTGNNIQIKMEREDYF